MQDVMDFNLFMMCGELNNSALTELPQGFHFRFCRRDELDIWMAFPFDDAAMAAQYRDYMTDFFRDVYGGHEDLFFESCVFLCDNNDKPVGTCFVWRAYDAVTTVHWFKVLREHEGRGLGRALLSHVLNSVPPQDFPVFLHTQPGSFRALKLYSDFGFAFLKDAKIGHRENQFEQSLPILRELMPAEVVRGFRTAAAPELFLKAVASSPINEF